MAVDSRADAPKEADQLTPREIEVLTCLAEGLTGKQCAKHLSVSLDTIQKHVVSTKRKLRANTRAHAVAIAYKRGILG
jgi:DNA-binding NarL/FixJ family response regulator